MSEEIELPHFGDVLKELLEDRELSQRQFAKYANVKQELVNLICNGKRRLSLENALLFAKVLGMDFDHLLRTQAALEKRHLEKDEVFQEKLNTAQVWS